MIKFETPEIKITVLEIKDTIATSTESGNGAGGDVGGTDDDD